MTQSNAQAVTMISPVTTLPKAYSTREQSLQHPLTKKNVSSWLVNSESDV